MCQVRLEALSEKSTRDHQWDLNEVRMNGHIRYGLRSLNLFNGLDAFKIEIILK